jgi:Zn-dependent protease with chaperone function
MRYLEMGFTFASIGFIVANTVLSVLIVLAWRVTRSSLRRSTHLFLYRMLPAIGSAAVVLGVILPAYWSFEPRETGESAGPALFAVALFAAALAGAGLYRAIVSWRTTRRLERAWTSVAIGTTDLGIAARTYRVPSDLPLAALVGVFRPRLFVSDRFLDELSAGERQAVVDHEAAHISAFDNLKRTVMSLAPDWVSFTAAGRQIESAWAFAAEEEADDRAAGSDRARALDLAAALLKAVRLAPMRCAHVSNFCDGATIARRVERLLEDSPGREQPSRSFVPRVAWVLAILVAAGLLASPALHAAYSLTEAASQLLQ